MVLATVLVFGWVLRLCFSRIIGLVQPIFMIPRPKTWILALTRSLKQVSGHYRSSGETCKNVVWPGNGVPEDIN